MRILWQSKSPLILDSFRRGVIDPAANGGNAYDLQAVFSLANHYPIEVDKSAVKQKSENIVRYAIKMQMHRAVADILIMEPFPIVFGNRVKRMKTIGMIHHIDPKIRRSGYFHNLYFNRLLKRLRELDKVVTVSVFWQKFLEAEGCENVEIIYNSFDLNAFQNLKKDNDAFRLEHQLPLDKKIIYIGNAIKEKGVYDVYEELKNSGFHLVMTGAQNRAMDLPVHYLRLNRNQYLQLLATSSVVIAMSKMVEGWNRIAHEALLSKTPVIGSGSGGMTELLEKAGQVKVTDLAQLHASVDQVLNDEKQYARRGYEYVKQFDLNYFSNRWKEVVETVRSK